MGQTYFIKVKSNTPISRMFRAGKPLVDQDKGVVNFELLMAPERLNESDESEKLFQHNIREFSERVLVTPTGINDVGLCVNSACRTIWSRSSQASLSEDEKWHYALSVDVKRRNLTTAQKRALVEHET